MRNKVNERSRGAVQRMQSALSSTWDEESRKTARIVLRRSRADQRANTALARQAQVKKDNAEYYQHDIAWHTPRGKR